MSPASCSSSANTVISAPPMPSPLPRAAQDNEVVRLQQEALRRTAGGARLSRALHPPRRDHQPPPDRGRRERRHLQMEGLPVRGPRSVQDDDARDATSSSAASSSTSCRRASIASATTGSSPTARAPRPSLVPASCWPSLAPKTDNTATTEPAPSKALAHPCPCCGGRMIIIATFEAGTMPRTRPPTANPIRIDTS